MGQIRKSGRATRQSGTPRTDIISRAYQVRKVPFPDSCIAAKQTLFDHFVRAGEHRCRQIEAERLGGFQIDHQLVLGRRLHRQISRLRSGPYQRNHGPCRSGPNVSVLFVQSSDEVAGRSSPGPRPQSNRTPNARAA